MRVGDLVRYWFARKYSVFGVVIEKFDYELNQFQPSPRQGTYLYSVEILGEDGRVEGFDIHEGDVWEVLSEGG